MSSFQQSLYESAFDDDDDDNKKFGNHNFIWCLSRQKYVCCFQLVKTAFEQKRKTSLPCHLLPILMWPSSLPVANSTFPPIFICKLWICTFLWSAPYRYVLDGWMDGECKQILFFMKHRGLFNKISGMQRLMDFFWCCKSACNVVDSVHFQKLCYLSINVYWMLPSRKL